MATSSHGGLNGLWSPFEGRKYSASRAITSVRFCQLTLANAIRRAYFASRNLPVVRVEVEVPVVSFLLVLPLFEEHS